MVQKRCKCATESATPVAPSYARTISPPRRKNFTNSSFPSPCDWKKLTCPAEHLNVHLSESKKMPEINLGVLGSLRSEWQSQGCGFLC